jgi:Putative inner membrane protein (DUF1819)
MDATYTVALAKGQGMPSETILLLNVWQEGMSAVELKRHVIANGLLPKATNHRTSDLVSRVFAPRYLSNGATAAKNLKYLLSLSVPADRLLQLFLIYTARANLILHDFITDVYWPHYNAGSRILQRQDAFDFFKAAKATGKMPSWSDGVRLHASRDLLSALTDFKLTRDMPQGRREIVPYNIQPATTLYLAHETHFSGMSDHAVLDHADWKLFGLDRQGVLEELRKVAAEGHFIVQFSDDLLRISWKYKSMEECLDGIAQR